MGDRGAARKYGWLLKRGSKYIRWNFFSQAVVLHVTHDAHDLPRALLLDRIRVVSQKQLLANGILVWKIPASERFVDHDGPRGRLGIALVQITSLPERDS